MIFKGTIIITDPCYVIRSTSKGIKPITKNDWAACNYGQDFEQLGIHNYISEDTIFGDWSCVTLKCEEPYKIVDNLADLKQDFDEKYSILESPGEWANLSDEYNNKMNDICDPLDRLGSFGADAGLVAVFDLNELRKYNPDIDSYIEDHPWCYTKIPNFDGEVKYYVDKNNEAHIIGIGNINFFTTQYGF